MNVKKIKRKNKKRWKGKRNIYHFQDSKTNGVNEFQDKVQDEEKNESGNRLFEEKKKRIVKVEKEAKIEKK